MMNFFLIQTTNPFFTFFYIMQGDKATKMQRVTENESEQVEGNLETFLKRKNKTNKIQRNR